MSRKLKTLMMLLIERDYPGKSIEQIMLDAFREHGTERAAARAMGITQQTYNVWKFRLGLDAEIEQLGEILAEFPGDPL